MRLLALCSWCQVLTLLERVTEAQRIAALQLRESGGVGPKSGKRSHRGHGDGDEEVGEGEEAEAVLMESMDKRRRLGKVMKNNKAAGRGGGGKHRGGGGGGGKPKKKFGGGSGAAF